MNTPKIRFKGFEDDWEQRKLGDVTQEFKSGTSLKAEEIDIVGDYPVYGGNGLRGYTSRYNHDDEYALIGRQGALCGNMNYSVGKAYFTEHAVVVKADDNNDTMFLYYLLDTMNLGQYSDQSAQPGLAVNKLVKLENLFPTKVEQQRIGWYFSDLDNLITLHQRKCDETKELKKYMLQKMFPKNGEKNPEIRFEGFTDDWEQCKLGDVCSRVQGNDGRMELPTLTISAGNGWMRQEDRFSGNIAGKEQKNYTLLRKGELSYNHGNSKLAKYGTVFSLQTYEEALVPRVYHSFKVKEGNCDFVEYYFATKLPDRELSKLISSGARMDGLLNIGYDEFMGIQMKFPSTLEQRKISLYFRKLDHLITLHQRKCEKLKALKKFMLQNMFI